METKPQKRLRALIADDHIVLLDLLKRHLESVDMFLEVATACSAQELMLLVDKKNYDIILLDIMFGDKNGIDLAKIILEKHKNAHIIFLTALVNHKVVAECFQLGALGFIHKTADLKEILKAIEAVLKNEKYVCKDSMNAIIDDSMESDEYINLINDTSLITEREKQVLHLLIEEMTVPEIANKLFISPRTVETHKKNLMIKLGAKTIIGLIKSIYQKHLINVF